MIIPHQQLAPDTLNALLEEYITREGTDYGEIEVTLEAKLAQLHAALRRKEVYIVFDPQQQSTSIVSAQDLDKFTAAGVMHNTDGINDMGELDD